MPVEATRFRWARDTRPGRTGFLARNPIVLTGFAVAVSLLLVGFWLHHATERALRDKLREGLGTVTAISSAAVLAWVKAELSDARNWAALPAVRTAARQLLVTSAEGSEGAGALLASPAQAKLLASLQSLVASPDYRGFGLVSRGGVVLASSTEQQVGLRLIPAAVAAVSAVMDGQQVMTRPYQRGELLVGSELVLDEPRMYAIVPVSNQQGEVIAGFFLTIEPERDFTRILSIARLGTTGDTYAFDQQGLMLSDSRHDAQLAAIGLIPDTPGARSILRVQLRDPGGDLTRGYRSDTPVKDRPLTQLAAAALGGDAPAQVIMDAYRDYRGVPVVGAYRWLPQYGIGLATEVPVASAFAASRPLRLMVLGLLGLLLFSALAIVVSSYALQRLRQRVDEVKQLGQYTLERKIGVGGMGEVYLARHALLRRPTAVKFIRGEKVSADNLEHFEREVQSTSQLTHPNTIEIYDYGHTREGLFYYAMEYLPGLTLASLMELEGAIPPTRAVFILRQLCASLEEAHSRGFVHRDVKPLNVILTERGGRFDFVKVLDFGLVREVRVGETENAGAVHEIAGTPPYIAPERLRDPSFMDIRSDLFSVGVIAFNLVTGKQPFEGDTTMEIVYHLQNSPAMRPSDASAQAIPPALDQLIVDCMAVDPAQRPATAGVIIARLDAITFAEPWDQTTARAWWAGNLKRVGSAGHAVAVHAREAIEQTADHPTGEVIN